MIIARINTNEFCAKIDILRVHLYLIFAALSWTKIYVKIILFTPKLKDRRCKQIFTLKFIELKEEKIYYIYYNILSDCLV